jgi:hypothetical protein
MIISLVRKDVLWRDCVHRGYIIGLFARICTVTLLCRICHFAGRLNANDRQFVRDARTAISNLFTEPLTFFP